MTSILLDTDSEKVQKDVCCHLLPCKIEYNGPTSVSDYFTPHIRGEDDHLTCSFRGRPLYGHKIRVPDGYAGVLLKDNRKLSLKTRELQLTGTFDQMTAWNWDLAPSVNDRLVQALQWMEVASALHRPLSEQQQEVSCKGQVKRKLSDSE